MLYVGIDDTDSATRGMCTTYLAAVVAERISPFATAEDRLLVRLNPNVEHKTRGNAALCLRFETDEPGRVKEAVVDAVEESAVFEDERTNPGVAFLRGEPTEALGRNTLRTLHEYVEPEEARRVAEGNCVSLRDWKNGRGVVGATAAVGAERAFDDWTYELLAYRPRERWGEDRRYDADSFRRAHEETYPRTCDTVGEGGEVVAVPSAPGPVLYGLRGTFEGVWEANSYVRAEEAERIAVYRTNQGTDAHIVESDADELYEKGSFAVEVTVVDKPETREGGHVFFGAEDDETLLECAAFEPTKSFRNVVRRLREGDRVVVQGSYVGGTLNVEKMKVVSLNRLRRVKPTCCGRTMESAGAGQGYRCRESDCDGTSQTLVEEHVERELEERWYEVPPSARRHLAKPLARHKIS